MIPLSELVGALGGGERHNAESERFIGQSFVGIRKLETKARATNRIEVTFRSPICFQLRLCFFELAFCGELLPPRWSMADGRKCFAFIWQYPVLEWPRCGSAANCRAASAQNRPFSSANPLRKGAENKTFVFYGPNAIGGSLLINYN